MKSRRPVNSDVRWQIESMTHKLPLGLLLAALLPCVNVFAQAQTNRADALRNLKGCSLRPIASGCNEGVAEYLIGLYDRGDFALMRPLVNAGYYSDGALSEVLGDFYANVLWKRPRNFLATLSSRSPHDQRTICMLASEMQRDQLGSVRRSLRRLSSPSDRRLSRVARICLAEIDRANASNTR